MLLTWGNMPETLCTKDRAENSSSEKNNFREPQRLMEKCFSPCPPRGCSKSLFVRPYQTPAILPLLPTGPGRCPKGVSTPVLLGCVCVATREPLLGSQGQQESAVWCCPTRNAVIRVCKVVGACAPQGRRWRRTQGESTCGGARGEGGRRPAGDRAGPEAHAWTGRWPCIGTMRLVSAGKKRNGHKVRGLPVWMQSMPTDIFMLTNVYWLHSLWYVHIGS